MMNKLIILSLMSVVLLLPLQTKAEGTAWILQIQGPIGPATSDYVKRGLEKARHQSANLIILKMDTPGGLDSAMREIVQAIMASSIPVVTYVTPAGARAASAGTYILYASHVAAMAPGTNLGAATPVQIGGMTSPSELKESPKNEITRSTDTMTHKMINDAEAYLRSLAQMHGRNEAWAIKAVRESASLSASEALEKEVIDLMAVNVSQLLEKINGMQVLALGKKHSISSLNLEKYTYQSDWRNQILSVITNPNIAYILMLLGMYGLFFELYNPGSILPGVIGGVSLILALFAFQVMPVNYAGIALILLGIAFMMAESFLPSFGILGIGGLLAFVIGSIILMDTDAPNYMISYSLIAGMTAGSVMFFLWLVSSLVQIRSKTVVTGKEGLLGKVGYCLSQENGEIRVYVHSEAWNAHSVSNIKLGQTIKVIGIQGLILEVKPIDLISKPLRSIKK